MKEEKIREAAIAEERRIEAEDKRVREWELKFDEEQRKKEEELIKKFKEKEKNESHDVKKKFTNDDIY